MSKSSPTSDIPNIDKIYEEGREPTEEEWIVWAKAFKPKSISERRPEHETLLRGKKAKEALKDRARKRKEYLNRKETGHKSWGEKYNAKRRYLIKYNEDYRERLKYQNEIRKYKRSRFRYDSWVNKYRKNYKNRLQDHANTYKIGEDKYVLGFSIKQLYKLGPLDIHVFTNYKNLNIFPPPVYTGFRFKKDKIVTEEEPFYLLTEVEAYMSMFNKNKKRMYGFSVDPNIKAFCQKKLWEGMLEARRIFDEENRS